MGVLKPRYRDFFRRGVQKKIQNQSSIKEKLLLQPSTMEVSCATNLQGHKSSRRLSSQGEEMKSNIFVPTKLKKSRSSRRLIVQIYSSDNIITML
ncbi:hypothetical protein K0M31_004377 [Melipona bicolor]|uniref:Uncharacterized protein n=1 Tax=Melipona bicolor TaxID=60889 RepID=A0AA40KN86_9HYME|nr:hypothetical protein K0M31_004377 [Melipona bicolor]